MQGLPHQQTGQYWTSPKGSSPRSITSVSLLHNQGNPD